VVLLLFRSFGPVPLSLALGLDPISWFYIAHIFAELPHNNIGSSIAGIASSSFRGLVGYLLGDATMQSSILEKYKLILERLVFFGRETTTEEREERTN